MEANCNDCKRSIPQEEKQWCDGKCYECKYYEGQHTSEFVKNLEVKYETVTWE